MCDIVRFFLTYRVKLGRMRVAFSESGKGDCFCGFFMRVCDEGSVLI